jgi:DNA (cytosine-5)-methyltransferase 1
VPAQSFVADPALAASDPGSLADGHPAEAYRIVNGRLLRLVRCSDGTAVETDFGAAPARAVPARLAEIADARWLRESSSPKHSDVNPLLFADLFCGCGALSLGAMEAARALGRGAHPVISADDDPAPLKVYEQSIAGGERSVRELDLSAALNGELGAKETSSERAFLRNCPNGLDLVLAGPPCQGHSSLNNHTRHDDERNDLYLRVVRFVELRRPRYCLIENVQSVIRDQRGSVDRTIAYMQRLNYVVDDAVVGLNSLGVPQTRLRHVVVAAAPGETALDVKAVVAGYATPRPQKRTVAWAIRDLRFAKERGAFDQASVPSKRNLERMNWLQRHDEDNLPNDERPDCHRIPKKDPDGNDIHHSYKSMYGRLSWGRPAQTITSGYGSMGQGRYVHPELSRTISPHEAARLQFFPDWMCFEAVSGRGQWARMIGNAAPMKLSYVFALEMFR